MLTPKLRFKRKDGTSYPDWNKEKWADLGVFVSSGTLSKSELSDTGTPCILYGELYTKYGEIAHTIYSKTNAEAHTFSKADDVILPKSGETPEDISTATCIPYDNVSLGGDLIVFRHNEKVIGSYLSYLISNRAKKSIASIAQGKSVVHINEKSLSKIELPYPEIEEQQKIANFLSNVDEVIMQSEAEVVNLEQQKKAAMQKIFSLEARFRREDGTEYPKWEDCILSNYCQELKASIDPKKYPYESFYEYSMPAFDMGKKPNSVLGRDMNSSRKIVSTPCVLINKLNVRKKRIWKVITPAINSVCSAEFIPVTSEKISIDFLEHLALSDRFTARLLDCSTGTSNSQKRVTPDIIMDMAVSIPCIEEQQKIASFLSAYDEAISYAKQELEKWKELKKGLLQQMFI